MSITTNGLLLTRWVKEIGDAHCRAISVSLDGPEDIHDRIRRKEGSFVRAVEGIKALAILPNPPKIGVYCTISEYNTGALVDFLESIHSLPVQEVGILHNNFVTAAQAESHNRQFGGELRATCSNIFETDPTRINLVQLSEELTKQL